MSKKKQYVIDDEGREKAKQYVDEWVGIARRATPMTPEEREKAIDAAIELYKAADLVPPPRHRIVVVPSPMIGAFVAGAASWIWHQRKEMEKEVEKVQQEVRGLHTSADSRAYATLGVDNYPATTLGIPRLSWAVHDATQEAVNAAVVAAPPLLALGLSPSGLAGQVAYQAIDQAAAEVVTATRAAESDATHIADAYLNRETSYSTELPVGSAAQEMRTDVYFALQQASEAAANEAVNDRAQFVSYDHVGRPFTRAVDSSTSPDVSLATESQAIGPSDNVRADALNAIYQATDNAAHNAALGIHRTADKATDDVVFGGGVVSAAFYPVSDRAIGMDEAISQAISSATEERTSEQYGKADRAVFEQATLGVAEDTFGAMYWQTAGVQLAVEDAVRSAAEFSIHKLTQDQAHIATIMQAAGISGPTKLAVDRAFLGPTFDAVHALDEAAAKATNDVIREADATVDWMALGAAIDTFNPVDGETDLLVEDMEDAVYSAVNMSSCVDTRSIAHDRDLDVDSHTMGTISAVWSPTDSVSQPLINSVYNALFEAARQDVTMEAVDRAMDGSADRATYDASMYEADRSVGEAVSGLRGPKWGAVQSASSEIAQAVVEAVARSASLGAFKQPPYTQGEGEEWYVGYSLPASVCRQMAGKGGLECAKLSNRPYQGGNLWAAMACYIAFGRDVAEVEADWDKYAPWETLARTSGFRWVHPEFCIISDFPVHLTLDDQGRGHNEKGPYMKWADGSALYSLHGVRVPARWIEEKDSLDPAEVIAHPNVEVRAAGAAFLTWAKMLDHLDCKVIDDSGSDDIGQLIELTLPGLERPGRFLKALCPRNGIICESVPWVSDVDGKPIDTALAAQAWRIGDSVDEYIHPPFRT